MKARTKTKRAHTPAGRGLRADAKRNRDRLLAAAEAVFTARGAAASLEDVAKRAKVGIGTLYRHFPTREALLAAACDERLAAVVERSRTREPSSSAADALRSFLEDLARHASTYRGLAESLGVILRSGLFGCHATAEEGRRLLLRAQRAGEICGDVAFDDVVCMATAISLAASGSEAKRIPRLVTMFVNGLRVCPEGSGRS